MHAIRPIRSLKYLDSDDCDDYREFDEKFYVRAKLSKRNTLQVFI